VNFFKQHGRKLVASLVITILVWMTLHKGGLKIVPEGRDFRQVAWWTVGAYFVSLAALTWFRSVRWRFLLRGIAEVPKVHLFAVSCIGFAAILLLPFRIGEFVRPYLIRTSREDRMRGVRPITMTAATSSVVAERIIDGLFTSVVLAVALVVVPTVHPLPDHVVGLPVSVAHVRMLGFAMLGLFGTAFATIAVFYFARGWAHRATIAVVGRVSRPLAEKLASLFEKFADGLHVLGNGRDALGFLFETSLYWGLNAGGMWLLARGCAITHLDGTAITFGEACGLMGMLCCAILIPGPPGALGVFQVGIYAGMTMYFPTSVVVGPGAAYVFLLYASQAVFQILAGALGLLLERRRLQELPGAIDGALVTNGTHGVG
jgi:hypothetical protein